MDKKERIFKIHQNLLNAKIVKKYSIAEMTTSDRPYAATALSDNDTMITHDTSTTIGQKTYQDKNGKGIRKITEPEYHRFKQI